MRCPRDNNQLNRTMSERLYGNGCHHCKGLFLSGNRTQVLKHNVEEKWLNLDNKQKAANHSKLKCPDCNKTMNLTLVDNIEIDICSHCFGVWFDKTEAQAIVNKYKQGDTSQNKIQSVPFPSEIVHLLSKWYLPKT